MLKKLVGFTVSARIIVENGVSITIYMGVRVLYRIYKQNNKLNNNYINEILLIAIGGIVSGGRV
jgi:prolipoprotein diacylglyceryltransferase